MALRDPRIVRVVAALVGLLAMASHARVAAEDAMPPPAGSPAATAASGTGSATPPDAGQTSVPPAAGAAPDLTLTVSGRQDSELGIATSAAQGTVGAQDLAQRPLLRVGEVMETIPGMIATEHSGGGKANQYYLRGFDLDHGTDFATSVDDIPVNLRTHAHGQGYSDLNFLIPELISTLDYRKGPYYAQDGDFDSAGAADIHYQNTVPELASLAVGMYGYARALAMGSPAFGNGHLLYAVAAEHFDGPWDTPENTRKGSGVLRYSDGDDLNGFSVTASAYSARWNATNQVPQRAIDEGLIGLYGNLSPSDGGNSSRYALSGEWRIGQLNSRTVISAYVFNYALDLWSDFTYFLRDPVHGDQFEQVDRRTVIGGAVTQTIDGQVGGHFSETVFGVQEQSDFIPTVALYDTEDRVRIATVSDDAVQESSIGVFTQNTCEWSSWFRSILGLRGDLYTMNVDASNPQNSGSSTPGILSPKATLVAGPWAKTEFYLNGGLGFHSNDARGVEEKVDPQTNAPLGSAPALVRSKGAEIGMRSDPLAGLHTTLGVFYLHLAHELIFDGDTGTTDSSNAPTERLGIEFSNSYKPVDWLAFDGDFSATHARFTEQVMAEGGGYGNHIPDAIPYVFTAGVVVDLPHGWYDSLRLRYFGHRPLNESDSVQSGVSFELNDRIGYRGKNWEAHVDLLNLLDRQDADQSYYYASQLKGEVAPVEDVNLHPEEPFEVRGEVSYTF